MTEATSGISPTAKSSVIDSQTLSTPGFRWVGLKKLTWKDPSGTERAWEVAFRTTRRSECDGVAVIAIVRYPKSGKADEVVLVSQFRPPVGAEVIEAPAGLVDAGESAQAAAERELLEETGFCGTVTNVSPIVPCDPGMTDANMRYVTIEIDGDAPENQSPIAQPDEGEFIMVRMLPVESLLEGLDALAEKGFQVDARLYAMAVGYSVGQKQQSPETSTCRVKKELLDLAKPAAVVVAVAAVVAAALALTAISVAKRQK
ncbi:unnamed protein product [Discosporangium mesarthrocarpum]